MSDKKRIRLNEVTTDMAPPHNVFADMGLPNPEMRQAKAVVSLLFEQALKNQGLTQTQAAQRTGLTQPEVSNVVRGRNSGFTLDRLLSAMAALGQDVEIILRDALPEKQRGTLRVARKEAVAAPPVQRLLESGGETAEVDLTEVVRGRSEKVTASRTSRKAEATPMG